MNQEFLLFPGFREMWRGRDVLYYPMRVRYLINYPRSKMGVSALLPYKSMVLLLRGQASRWVEENGICFWGHDRRFLKEINSGGDEICLILGNPGETQPPPRVAISPQVFPPHLQFPETGFIPGSPEDTETEPLFSVEQLKLERGEKQLTSNMEDCKSWGKQNEHK